MSTRYDPNIVFQDLHGPPTYLEFAHDFLRLAVYTSFIWIPFLFVAYAVGRRKFGLWFIIVFTAAEAIAILLAIWMYQGWWEPLAYHGTRMEPHYGY